MDHLKREELEAAARAVAAMTARSENAREKFARGTPQHTLQANRINALIVAAALIAARREGTALTQGITREALERARAPLASLMSKSEKARQKLRAGSWQHRLLTENVRALRLAVPLLEEALALKDMQNRGL